MQLQTFTNINSFIFRKYRLPKALSSIQYYTKVVHFRKRIKKDYHFFYLRKTFMRIQILIKD